MRPDATLVYEKKQERFVYRTPGFVRTIHRGFIEVYKGQGRGRKQFLNIRHRLRFKPSMDSERIADYLETYGFTDLESAAEYVFALEKDGISIRTYALAAAMIAKENGAAGPDIEITSTNLSYFAIPEDIEGIPQVAADAIRAICRKIEGIRAEVGIFEANNPDCVSFIQVKADYSARERLELAPLIGSFLDAAAKKAFRTHYKALRSAVKRMDSETLPEARDAEQLRQLAQSVLDLIPASQRHHAA